MVAGAARADGDLASGYFLRPTVFADVQDEMTIAREEIFGPVATIMTYDDLEQAIEIANDTPYGLGSYVYTTDSQQALRVADALDTGMVYINGVGLDAPELPFGGTKRSGFGRELGPLGIEEFLNKKLIRING